MRWHGYFVIERTANLNEANWVTVVDEVFQITGDGDDPSERNHWRGSAETFNAGTEEEPLIYSNTYLFAGNFQVQAVDFAKFQTRLENVFEVEPGSVTYATTQVTLDARPTVIATYTYGVNDRMRVALLGCASDTELCTKLESNVEAIALILVDKAKWGEE